RLRGRQDKAASAEVRPFQQLLDLAEDAEDSLGWRVVTLENATDARLPSPHVLLEISAHQLFFAAKGVVEGGLGDVGLLDYPVDADHVHALPIKELVGGGKQSLPSRLCLLGFQSHLDGRAAAVDGDRCTGDIAGLR